MRKLLLKWASAVVAGLAGSFLLGVILERIIAHVSFYEMAAPGRIRGNVLLFSLPLSFIAGAVATWSNSLWKVTVVRLLAVCAIALTGGIGLGGIAGMLSKLHVLQSFSSHVSVPAPRVWFCGTLIKGALFFGCAGYLWFLNRERPTG